MKLIECYIENFGKLSSYSHSFSDGLNVIVGSNGCGKTTLSVFIKSMLYGIESKKTKGEDTDRKRYMPWQGGRCGGSLTFENEGKIYRIERTFGEKPSGDSFAIYNAETGSLSSDFSENVGEELFDIDADGFERTVFLSERKFAVSGNNQTISAKLSNLVGVDGDMGSFDYAVDELVKKEKYYRHRRGKGGLIGDIKNDISELEIEIIDIARKKDLCTATEKELSEIRAKISAAEASREALENKRLSSEYEKEYKAKLDSLGSYTARLEKEKEFFSAHLPTSEEIRNYEQKKNKALILSDSLEKKRAAVTSFAEQDTTIVEKHLSTLNALKSDNNVNKSFHFWGILAIVCLICSIVLGVTISPILFILSLFIIPPVYLELKNKKAASHKVEENSEKDEILAFLSLDRNTSLTNEELYERLLNVKAEILAAKKERESLALSLKESEELISGLNEECEVFLSKFKFETDDVFGELRSHLALYENLIEAVAEMTREAEVYAKRRGLTEKNDSNDVSFSQERLDEIDAELKQQRSVKYALEGRLSTLYDEIAREDELREKKLELGDSLLDAEENHKVTVKATEHLMLAKERLTAKYLGKMREAFNLYIDSIASENGKSFNLDTDFSLTKTENGLTNPHTSYSLGTKELYSLVTRLALVDALYEKNAPFIVLDDPFCHFDDEKCVAALGAITKISKDKQIIYLTCANSRTPD